jgi:predicted GNAT family acetyltransferase
MVITMLESLDSDKQSTQMAEAHIEEARHGNGQDMEQTAAHKALVRKQDLRIIPLCAFIYLLCFLDRSNIGS